MCCLCLSSFQGKTILDNGVSGSMLPLLLQPSVFIISHITFFSELALNDDNITKNCPPLNQHYTTWGTYRETHFALKEEKELFQNFSRVQSRNEIDLEKRKMCVSKVEQGEIILGKSVSQIDEISFSLLKAKLVAVLFQS